MSALEVLVAVTVALGFTGILLPVLPGTLLIGAAILLWSVQTGGRTGWLVGGTVVAILLLGAVLKYVLPGRRLSDAGVSRRTLWLGAVLGFAGFFLIPVVGLFLGFVLGVYLGERQRLGAAAWPSTVTALRAVGLSIMIELAAALLATLAWVAGVVAA